MVKAMKAWMKSDEMCGDSEVRYGNCHSVAQFSLSAITFSLSSPINF